MNTGPQALVAGGQQNIFGGNVVNNFHVGTGSQSVNTGNIPDAIATGVGNGQAPGDDDFDALGGFAWLGNQTIAPVNH